MSVSGEQDHIAEDLSGPPDRPIAAPLRPLRSLLRRLRLWRIAFKCRGRISFGEDVSFGANAVLQQPTSAVFGDHVRIGRDFLLMTDLEVGDEVLIGSRVTLVNNDHRFDVGGESIFYAGRLPVGKVVLEGDNLLGAAVVIVGPATIGKGCIVGAGSVVTGDLPPNTVCAGSPARVIRDRDN